MLLRFSLYGFLKNQQYYDPFIALAFYEKLGSWFLVGVLIGFREMMVNLMEIPTGAIADVCGRRKSMIMSFAAYIVSFAIFGSVETLPLLFLAMAFFAVGDAFRTGTHKAMIFTWLRLQGRADERTKTYGYTRSWSKLGSALSVIFAGVIVFFSKDYNYLFYFCIAPYILSIINFLGYPKDLDGLSAKEGASIREIVAHLKDSFLVSIKNPSIRRLMLESMGFEGVFKSAKDYLQPILKNAAIPLCAAIVTVQGLGEKQKAVVLIIPVYFALYILSAVASRNSHRLVDHQGAEDKTARFLWGMNLAAFAALIPAIYYGIHWAMILGFAALYVMQNLWRPVLISRFDIHSDEAKGATLLSIENQAKSGSAMIAAPLLGFIVDIVKQRGIGDCEFWPVGVLGALIALGFFLTSRSHSE